MASFANELEVYGEKIKIRVVAIASGLIGLLTTLALIVPTAGQSPLLTVVNSLTAIACVAALVMAYLHLRDAATRVFVGALALGALTYHAVGLDTGAGTAGTSPVIPYIVLLLVLSATLLRGREVVVLHAVVVIVAIAVDIRRSIGGPDGVFVGVFGNAVVLVLASGASAFSALLAESVHAALTVRLDQIEIVLDRAKRVAVGDLTWSVEGEGDVPDTLREMNRGLRELVDQIQRAASSLGAASTQLAAMAAEQERSALELAGGFEEIQRTLAGFNESSTQIADHTRKVADVANQTVQTNHLIDEQLRGLASHTERIKDILSTINGIANKSDLLALNASLEAVRAGDSGRGFALVASQMQKLAESVVASVEDIRVLTSDIRSASAASLSSSTQAAQLAETTSTRAEEISLITQQQRSATSAVVEAVKDISEYTRQSSEASAEGSASVRDLQVLARDLRELVSRFTLVEGPVSSGAGRRA